VKAFGNFLKVLAALAAVAGVVYVVIQYGDKISAWGKKFLREHGLCCCSCNEVVEVPTEEVFAEEAAPTENQAAEEDFESAE